MLRGRRHRGDRSADGEITAARGGARRRRMKTEFSQLVHRRVENPWIGVDQFDRKSRAQMSRGDRPPHNSGPDQNHPPVRSIHHVSFALGLNGVRLIRGRCDRFGRPAGFFFHRFMVSDGSTEPMDDSRIDLVEDRHEEHHQYRRQH